MQPSSTAPAVLEIAGHPASRTTNGLFVLQDLSYNVVCLDSVLPLGVAVDAVMNSSAESEDSEAGISLLSDESSFYGLH
jgi:hypothetical protein